MNFCIFICLFTIVFGNNVPEVHIKYGKLEGKYMPTRKGRQVVGFLGIPYAKPPLNELRFKSAVPVEPWEGILKADQDVPFCIQKDIFTSQTDVSGVEDCLHLNVYTPKLPKDGSKNFPVMVYINGGGFICGSAHSSMYGPEYLLDENIVLVIPNYRLGPLGFISTGDDEVPGNMGLKDQVLALKWVQENIVKFGGDPKSVTIFGNSAGGAGIHYHMISPLSNGLFHRAIAQSGTSNCRWALEKEGETKRNTEKLAKSVKCPIDDSKKMIKCLQNVTATELIDKTDLFFKWDMEPLIPFKPRIEHNHPNALISKHPSQILKDGESNEATLILGLTSSEGCIRLSSLYSNPKLLNEFSNNFEKLIPISMFYESSSEAESITKRIKEFYFKNKKIGKDTFQELTDLYSDGWFIEGIFDSLNLHLKYNTKTPIYLYYFDYRGSKSLSTLFGGSDRDYGVCHGDELFYLLNFMNALYTSHNESNSESDNKMIDVMVNIWTSFAKTGKPTLNNEEIWMPITSDNMEYIHIKNYKDITRNTNLLKERIDIWKSLSSTKYSFNKKDEF